MNENATKIIATYKKISDFVFHYLIFFVVVAIAAYVFQQTISQSAMINIFQTNESLLMQKSKLIAWFNKFLNQNIQDNNIRIDILQWDLQIEQGFIKSVNNLIFYKWFVVPRYFYLYNTLPNKPITYFSWNTYATNELENFVNTFVFTKKITTITPFIRTQLPISTSILQDFNLSCVFENKLSATTCNYYLHDFLDGFFVYTLSSDYAGLKNIFMATKNSPETSKSFCDWLSKYLLYANDYSDPIKELFTLCGPSYEEIFKKNTLFMEIQNGLESQSFEKTSYKDVSLNAYKLLSYQQQIYQDFLVNKADTYKIATYLDFVRELLKKNTIESFYKDEIYRYNNHYLSASLEALTYQTNSFTQNLWGSKISALLTTLHTLNDGEPMLWFVWLSNQVINTSLLINNTNDTDTWTMLSLTTAEKIQKKLKNISYLTIEQQSISDTTIDMIGYLRFTSSWATTSIKSHIIMTYSNDTLLVKSIELDNKKELNDVIKNLLLIQNFSLGELYSYISKTIDFYTQWSTSLATHTDSCSTLWPIQDTSRIFCSATGIILDKGTIRYLFTLQDGNIANVAVSDTWLETSIKAAYMTITTNATTLWDRIQALVSYTQNTAWYEWTTNTLIVMEQLKKYLGEEANDVADNSGKILVDISLGWINFIVPYDLTKKTLGPWYFKDIIANGKPYQIQKFNLVLDDAHQNSINSFVVDPLTTIKNADLTARQNYQAFIKVKN